MCESFNDVVYFIELLLRRCMIIAKMIVQTQVEFRRAQKDIVYTLVWYLDVKGFPGTTIEL